MSTLSDLRSAVVSSLAAKLSVPVAAHGGTFDLEELKRFALNAPSVRVCIVGARSAGRYRDGRWGIDVQLAAVIITRDTVAAGAKTPRDTAALLLATAVELAVAGNRFGVEGVGQPTHVEARNEYSGTLDTVGAALWQVTWTSSMLLGDPVASSADAVIAALVSEAVNGTVEWTAAGGLAAAEPALPEPVVAAPEGAP